VTWRHFPFVSQRPDCKKSPTRTNDPSRLPKTIYRRVPKLLRVEQLYLWPPDRPNLLWTSCTLGYSLITHFLSFWSNTIWYSSGFHGFFPRPSILPCRSKTFILGLVYLSSHLLYLPDTGLPELNIPLPLCDRLVIFIVAEFPGSIRAILFGNKGAGNGAHGLGC
jgi:hypothetical protein